MASLTPRPDARFFALIPAAGVGARSGAALPKQYLTLAGKPMLRHVVETFGACADITQTVIVVSEDDGYIDALVSDSPRCRVLRVGGPTRHVSVLNGMRSLQGQISADDWVLVHDAARPGLTPTLLTQLIATLRDDILGGLLALPVVDTLKRANAEGRAQETVARDSLWAAQTPQMFRYDLLRAALESAIARSIDVTDEASAIEAYGQHRGVTYAPRLVLGSVRNFKLTLPQDIALAELYLSGLD